MAILWYKTREKPNIQYKTTKNTHSRKHRRKTTKKSNKKKIQNEEQETKPKEKKNMVKGKRYKTQHARREQGVSVSDKIPTSCHHTAVKKQNKTKHPKQNADASEE